MNTDYMQHGSNHLGPGPLAASSSKLNGVSSPSVNGKLKQVDGMSYDMDIQPSQEELESELPVVYDGQVPLGELLSRMAQSIYAELVELAETLPNNSDMARKRLLADWVVKIKKQVVKVYAIVKWARDSEDVQKAMNITAFLMEQNRQFEEAIQGVTYTKDSLAPARLRNHDILTSLDVLTSGTYQRLPTVIKNYFIPPKPLTLEKLNKTFRDMEDVIRFRLRVREVIPVEMKRYVVEDGRVFFTIPKLFETSLSLIGARPEDGWFFVHVKFLHNVGGDQSGLLDFPPEPTGIVKQHITEEADRRLRFYLAPPPEVQLPPDAPPPPRLPENTVDVPLVRLFNFLQMLSLSYQLELLFFQAQRLRSLGWGEYLTVERSPDGKSLTASYWIRPTPNPNQNRRQAQLNRFKIPSLGGKLTIALQQFPPSSTTTTTTTNPNPSVNARSKDTPASAPAVKTRSHKDIIMAELERMSKLKDSKPSDEVEHMRLHVTWEPARGALGVVLPPGEEKIVGDDLVIDPTDIDFAALIGKVIKQHIHSILKVFQYNLQNGPISSMFSHPDAVVMSSSGGLDTLHVHLCAEEVTAVSIDPRTGRITLKDLGDLSSAGNAPRSSYISERLNESPTMIYDTLVKLRLNTITQLAEQKAAYLGLQTFRHRNFSREETLKWGNDVRSQVFVQLAKFPSYYLVIFITDTEFRYALISVKVLEDSPQNYMVIEDIGWLDLKRIHGEGENQSESGVRESGGSGKSGKRSDSFRLETRVLRELYAYCCARVAYTKVELQLKQRGIHFTRVNPPPTQFHENLDSAVRYVQSNLARSIPGLCVQSSDILAGAPAAEAAMPNIRVIPLGWWSDSERKLEVLTCVKLKYVQQPVGKRSTASNNGNDIIRPSKRIIYDAREAIVSFLSEDVDSCVDEFLEEWAKVSKMVVIAREVAQMSRNKSWSDVQLLSFDLQTVEFAYAEDYTISITCTDQLLLTSDSYELRFSRSRIPRFSSTDDTVERRNPHEDAELFLKKILRHGHRDGYGGYNHNLRHPNSENQPGTGSGSALTASLNELVAILRDTTPIVAELETMRSGGDEVNAIAVDVFPKGAAWYRVVYGDMRHALDLRLVRGRQIHIQDASYATMQSTPASSSQLPAGLFRPIPDLKTIIKDAVIIVRTLISKNAKRGQLNIAQMDVGVVCGVDMVRVMLRSLHAGILRRLLGGSGGSG